jgi:hypothetical protein
LTEPKKAEVLGLLRDRAVFEAAFGGALPLSDQHLRAAEYGPGGFIERGEELRSEGNIKLLAKSYELLNVALRLLQREDIGLWESLVEAYLGDPADPGIITHWRKQVVELDAENTEIRSHNRLVRTGKKPGPLKHEKVGYVVPRMLLERHDQAIERLAQMLANVDLYYIPASQMSEQEASAGEHTERQMYAAYQRYRNAGNRSEQAVEHTAREFGVPTDRVETVIEFRRNTSEDECMEPGCDRAPFSQMMCMKHYQRRRRAQYKTKSVS